MKVPAAEDDFRILTRSGSFRPVPASLLKLLPRSMTYSTPFDNHGNYIISLGQLTPWLAHKAESAGVEVFAGFCRRARPCSMSAVPSRGCASATWGWTATASPGPTSPPAWRSTPPSRLLAEGARGSVSKELIAKFDLGRGHCPQTFALGFKELWQLPAGRVRPGRIEHALGWPADFAHLRRQLPLSSG